MVHYLDHAASTPVHPDAVAAMTKVLTESYGNPSGAHRLAREANLRLDAARASLATSFGVTPGSIVFTSGGTEADSLAIHGALRLAEKRLAEDHNTGATPIAVCSAIEHHAVLEPVEDTGGLLVDVDSDGALDLAHLRLTLENAAAAEQHVAVVSIMAANNETGVVQPIKAAAEVVREFAPEALLHTDAVQFPAWNDTADLAAVVDLMSVSGHKWGGPKGSGFLVVRDGVTLPSIQLGGGQERGRRGGTQNVAGIVSLAAAAQAMVAARESAVPAVETLRDDLIQQILGGVANATVTGERVRRLPNIAHFCIPGVESEPLLFLLEKDDIMASAASSCASGAQQASHVLAAMGIVDAVGAIRLSLGYSSTQADVDAAAASVVAACERIRSRG